MDYRNANRIRFMQMYVSAVGPTTTTMAHSFDIDSDEFNAIFLHLLIQFWLSMAGVSNRNWSLQQHISITANTCNKDFLKSGSLRYATSIIV